MRFALIVFFAIPVTCTLPDLQEAFVLDVLWFWAVYIFAKLIMSIKRAKVQNVKILTQPTFLLMISAIVYTALVCMTLCERLGVPGGAFISTLAHQYLFDIKSLPNFFIAVCVFVAFLRLKPTHIRVVNLVASTTYAVYLFHQVPAFFPNLWLHVFRTDVWVEHGHPFWYCFVVVIVVFCVVFGIEYVRRRVVEPLFLRSRVYAFLHCQLDKLTMQGS